MISTRSHLAPSGVNNQGIGIVFVIGMAITYVVTVFVAPTQLVAAVIFAVVLGTLALLRPSTAVGAVFAYLALLGDLRRYLVAENGLPSSDPLLVVGPAVVALLVALALKDGLLNLRTREAKLVLAMMMIMTLEIINPLQGGIVVGLAGVLFNMIPLAWFWIGQAYGFPSTVEKIIYRVVVPLAVLAAILGIVQQTKGFLGYEARWFRISAAEAARPDMRPFSFFSSWAEYPFYLGVALTAVIAPVCIGKVRASLLLVPFFIVAMLIQSVREAIFSATLAVAVLWSVQGRTAAAFGTRLTVATVLAIASLVAGMTVLKSADLDVDQNTQKMLDHTSDGVLDIGNSTAGGHLELVGEGIWFGITHPVGIGTGGNSAANKYGGDLHTSEIDFSDMFIAFGLGGGVLYCYLMYRLISTTIIRWRSHREPLMLLGLALMFSQIGHWGHGGLYAVSALTWYVIGSTDRVRGLALLEAPMNLGSSKMRRPAPVKLSGARPMPGRNPMPARSPLPRRVPMLRPNGPARF